MNIQSVTKKSDSAEEAIRINPPQNMNVAEAALYLGLGQRTVRDFVALKRFKVVRFGRRIVIRKADLDAYLERLAS